MDIHANQHRHIGSDTKFNIKYYAKCTAHVNFVVSKKTEQNRQKPNKWRSIKMYGWLKRANEN